MKKVIKYLLFIFAGLILIVVSAAAYIKFTPIPSYENKAKELQVKVTPERVEKGLKLASMMCKNCHLGSTSGKLDGKIMEDLDPTFGVAYAKNITKHPQFGSGAYTDGEVEFLLRTGIKKDGQYAPPWMPKFPHMADEDLYSIIAFLRSAHPLVASSEKVHPANRPSFFAKFLCRVAFKSLPFPANPIPLPNTSNGVENGKYLALGALDCFGCHSLNFENVNSMEPEKSVGFFGGGNIFPTSDGALASANITPDPKTGIGKWTKNEFITALKYGKKPDGSPMRYPMPPFPMLEDKEAGDIYDYLMTVPAIDHEVDRDLKKE